MIDRDVINYIASTLLDPIVSDAEAIDLLVNLRNVFQPADRKHLFRALPPTAQDRLKWCVEKLESNNKIVVGGVIDGVAIAEVGMMFVTMIGGEKVEISDITEYQLPISEVTIKCN